MTSKLDAERRYNESMKYLNPKTGPKTAPQLQATERMNAASFWRSVLTSVTDPGGALEKLGVRGASKLDEQTANAIVRRLLSGYADADYVRGLGARGEVPESIANELIRAINEGTFSTRIGAGALQPIADDEAPL